MSDDELTQPCLLGSEEMQIPRSLMLEADVFHKVLSYDTWIRELTDEDRRRLLEFLPSNDVGDQQALIRDLFDGSNFKFGNPLSLFQAKLASGYFEPSVSRSRVLSCKTRQRRSRLEMQQYHTRTLEQLIVRQQMYIGEALRSSTKQELWDRLRRKSWQVTCKRSLQPMDCSDAKAIARAARSKKRRILKEVREESGCLYSSSTDEEGSDDEPFVIDDGISSKRYMQLLRNHCKRRRQHVEASSSHDTQTISSVHDIIGRVYLGRVRRTSNDGICASVASAMHNPNGLKSHDGSLAQGVCGWSPLRQTLKAKKYRKKISKHADLTDDDTAECQSGSTENFERRGKRTLPDMDVLPSITSSDWTLDANGLESQRLPNSGFFTLHHDDFFALLGHIIQNCPNSRASTQKVEERVREWQEAVIASKTADPASALCSNNKWYADGGTNTNWVELVLPALKFLAGDTSSGVPYNGTFVPLVDYKERLQLWRWLGIEDVASTWQRQPAKSETAAGCPEDDSNDTRESSSYRRSLWTHWLENRSAIIACVREGSHGGRKREPTPPSRFKTTYVVRPSTDQEKAIFRKQESERFANPRRSFTYCVNGYDAVVGPVKGVYEKPCSAAGGNKAREHALLVSERPSYVTILILVRDAAARLPNGEGTRSDICELLKDSQYLADGITESQINTVVSGALDRLHYEPDPCVKYDVVRKLWIYLHRNRSEDEFERIHEVQGAVVKAKRAHTKYKSLGPKRLKLSTSTGFSAAEALPESSGGADDGTIDDLDEPALSPLPLLPMDSPPMLQLPLPASQDLLSSPIISAVNTGGAVVTATSTVPPVQKCSTPTVQSLPKCLAGTPTPGATGSQQSLINRLVVTNSSPGHSAPVHASKAVLPAPAAAAADTEVSTAVDDLIALHAGCGASTAMPVTSSRQHQQQLPAQQQQQQQQQDSPVPVQATSAAVTASSLVVSARQATVASTGTAQQHYTFSFVPSTSVAGTSIVVPVTKTSIAAATTVLKAAQVGASSGTNAAVGTSASQIAGAVVQQQQQLVGAAAAAVTSLVQQRRRGTGARHIVIRQPLTGVTVGDAVSAPPASPTVTAATTGQIRLRLEQPLSLVAPMATRPVSGSLVLQPTMQGVTVNKSTAAIAASSTVVPAAANPSILAVRDGSPAVTVGSIVTAKQVFGQKAPGVPGATVLQKIITAVPHAAGKVPGMTSPVAVVQAVTHQPAAAPQMVARIVQTAAPSSSSASEAPVHGGSGRVIQQLISTVPASAAAGKMLALPVSTLTRTVTSSVTTIAPGTTFKLVAAPQTVSSSKAVGTVNAATLMKPGNSTALLTEKGAKFVTASDGPSHLPGTHLVLANSASHFSADGSTQQKIIISSSSSGRSALQVTPISAQKTVSTVTLAAGPRANAVVGGASVPTTGGQVITTYYAPTSRATSASPATAFILTKSIATVPGSSSTVPTGAVLSTQQQVSYNVTDGTAKGKNVLYGRLVAGTTAQAGSQPQQHMVITKPVGGSNPTTTVIVGQSPVTKSDSLIIVPVKKAQSEK